MAHPAMDRRLRSPSAARGCGSTPPPRGDERHHRFLRPGALARLRDSKIVARSLRSAVSASAPRLLPPSSPPPSATPSPAAADGGGGGGVPHFFVGSARGPRYPLRKKLAAARSVVFLPPPMMSPDAFGEAFLDAFAAAPSELLAAH